MAAISVPLEGSSNGTLRIKAGKFSVMEIHESVPRALVEDVAEDIEATLTST